MVTTKIASIVEQRVDNLMVAAQSYYGTKLRRPSVNYNLRGFAAGSASLVGLRLSLNPVFLYENIDQYVDETVGHEFSHTLVYQKHGIVRYNHGKQWQTLMRALHVPIKIDHTYDVSTIVGRRRKLNLPPIQVAEDDEIMVLYQQCRDNPVLTN